MNKMFVCYYLALNLKKMMHEHSGPKEFKFWKSGHLKLILKIRSFELNFENQVIWSWFVKADIFEEDRKVSHYHFKFFDIYRCKINK